MCRFVNHGLMTFARNWYTCNEESGWHHASQTFKEASFCLQYSRRLWFPSSDKVSAGVIARSLSWCMVSLKCAVRNLSTRGSQIQFNVSIIPMVQIIQLTFAGFSQNTPAQMRQALLRAFVRASSSCHCAARLCSQLRVNSNTKTTFKMLWILAESCEPDCAL